MSLNFIKETFEFLTCTKKKQDLKIIYVCELFQLNDIIVENNYIITKFVVIGIKVNSKSIFRVCFFLK